MRIQDRAASEVTLAKAEVARIEVLRKACEERLKAEVEFRKQDAMLASPEY